MRVHGSQDCALAHAREELHQGNIRAVIKFIASETASVMPQLQAGGESRREAEAWLRHLTTELTKRPPWVAEEPPRSCRGSVNSSHGS